MGICAGLVIHPEPFSQLGMGWLLRELSRLDRNRATRLRQRRPKVNREALRCAIEKMPRVNDD